jgi:hypothetical protein
MSTNHDKFLYKQRPYIYALIGIGALAFAKDSKLYFVSGLILIICAYLIFMMRKRFQERVKGLKIKNIQKAQAEERNKNIITIDTSKK